MRNIKEISLKVLISIEMIIGIVILISAFVFELNSEIKKAGIEIQDNIQYIKELCNSSEIRDMASEAKSLMQATEGVKQIRNSLDYTGDISAGSDSKKLKALAEDNYLDGLLLLDDKGKLKSEYEPLGPDGESLLAMINKDEILDTIAFSEKIYNIRLQLEDGGHIDLAAACTRDREGVIVGYFYTSAAYENAINNPVKTVVNGVNRESNGYVVVGDDTDVLYSNDESLIGNKIENISILKAIKEKGSRTELAYAKSEGKLFDFKFGLMDKSRNYSIYVFMDQKDYLSLTIARVIFILFLYLIVIAIVDVILWRNHVFYEREKNKEKQKHLKALEAKNQDLENALKQAQNANEAKTTFLSNMSHDIRTPINGIIGLLKINQGHFDDTDLVKENHKKMQVAADHLLSLINDILEMSKIEDGKITLGHEFINFAELSREINFILENRATENGISLDFVLDMERSFPCIYGSPVHLRQIFLNVYSNCIKYNQPGGSITTEVALLEETENNCVYQWTISDTGIGMSKDFLEHIFEPFIQEKSDARTVYQGVGLGMSITKSLVEKMGGTIKVSSEEGVGSTFVITIPFEIAKEQPDVKTTYVESIKDLHIMLAEDNELNAEIAKALLEEEGASVITVGNGQQAIDLFNQNPEGTFDAILMDIMMPEMDGLAATKAIRALNRNDAQTIPIIAMTANAFAEDKDKCLEAGMNEHLTKPLDIEVIKEVLCKFVRHN